MHFPLSNVFIRYVEPHFKVPDLFWGIKFRKKYSKKFIPLLKVYIMYKTLLFKLSIQTSEDQILHMCNYFKGRKVKIHIHIMHLI